jgi:hypothetical protein
MRNILIMALIMYSSNIFSAHHEETNLSDNNHMLLSTYEIAPGQNPADLEKELASLQIQQEEDGYNDCGLYRHWYGGQRAFYAYCFFKDFEQLDAIHKTAEANEDRMEITQNYSSHTDHILDVQKLNMGKAPKNNVWMSWKFGPYLTLTEKQERAEMLFDAFNRAFGGCDLYFHSWGPELAHYISCGFENFADFGKKHVAINKILEEELSSADLDLLEHADDLLTLVQD